jgi:hypothetical protein
MAEVRQTYGINMGQTVGRTVVLCRLPSNKHKASNIDPNNKVD